MRNALIFLAGSGLAVALPDQVTYNAQIRSVLSDKCIACHGPDSKKREAGLRLDIAEGAFAALGSDSKRFAIVPNHPEKSEIFARIDSDDPDEVMPPPHFHKHITKHERELLWKWIEQGAKYEAHWAYTPIKKSKPESDERNPIDAFILDQLKKKKIEPSPRAEPMQLLRRLSLDLTGLPPTSGEMISFEKAAAIDFDSAFEAEVNRLLESPRFGERMAVPWLDIVRFADTVGYHGDQNVRIFPYRDYVISAFNQNKPFDQFITEQLAGDLLENPTDEQLVATGFNRLGMMSREGGIQPKEYIAKYAADRVRAVGQAFLGQTTGCAECHDHKFDPISARDFYSMAAFFDDVLEWGVYQNYLPLYKGLQAYNNDAPFPPELVVKSDSKKAQIKLLHDRMVSELSGKKIDPAAFRAWKENILPEIKATSNGWAPTQNGEVTSDENTPFRIHADSSVEFTGPAQKDDVLHLKFTLAHQYLGSIEIQALPSEATGKVGRNGEGGFLVRGPANSKEAREKNKKLPVNKSGYEVYLKRANGDGRGLEFSWVQADLFAHNPRGFRNGALRSSSLDGVWQSAPGIYEYPKSLVEKPQTFVLQLKSAVKLEPGDQLVVRLHSADISRVKVRTSPFLDPIPGQSAAPKSVLAGLTKNDESALKAAYQLSQGSLEEIPQHLKQLRTRIRRLEAGWARTLVTATRPLEDRLTTTRILNRGDWQDETGPEVAPAVFGFLPSDSVAKDRRLTRLDLAKWLTAAENPLTARHFVNRTWKQLFGSGLSNVLADLGAQGEWPSHPKLIDWLAADFRENGWDVKNIIRKMVTSKAYQRKAAHRYELKDLDPGYRLYAQQAPRRLDAEFIRDNALAISGLLNTEVTGGPSGNPYQPAGYYKPISFPNRTYPTSMDENQYRRGVYTHWQRTFLHPMMANFDAPSRSECASDRTQANSPQQALTLLNDPTFTEAARAFAVQLMEVQDDQELIKTAYRRALARGPRQDEMESLTNFLKLQRENIAEGKDDPAKFLSIGHYRAPENLDQKELAARTQLCRVVLNLHETITRY